MVLDMNPYMDKTSEGKEISPSSALKAELIKSCKQTVAPRASHSRSLITFEPKSDAEKVFQINKLCYSIEICLLNMYAFLE